MPVNLNYKGSRRLRQKIKTHYLAMDERAIAIITTFEGLTNQQKIAIRDNLGNQGATQAQRILSLEVAWAFEHVEAMSKR